MHLLLGKGAMLDAWGEDGEVLHIIMPSESEVSNLESASEKKYKSRMETAKPIPNAEKNSSGKGLELSRTPVEMKSGDWALKVVPWIGGRILSMEHIPSGATELLIILINTSLLVDYSHIECELTLGSDLYNCWATQPNGLTFWIGNLTRH